MIRVIDMDSSEEIETNLDHFPDGTALIHADTLAHGDVEIQWNYESDAELADLIYITRHLREHKARGIWLYMPYIPNARQDRVKTQADVFTLKHFAWIINMLKFDRVIVFDPHSHVSEALFDNIQVLSPLPAIVEVLDKIDDDNIMLFYPDEGAMKRYSSMFKRPFAFGVKDRDWETGKINGLEIPCNAELVRGRNVLIVDDICSRGGTFYHSARKLKELGAEKIYLYVSHCENTILDGDLLKGDLIERVYTTDSIFTKRHEKIEVIGI